MAMPRLCGGWSVTSMRSIITRPVVGRSSPAMMRSSVVLPEPEGPSREMNSLCATAMSTRSTAQMSPYCFETPSSDI